MSGKTNIMIGLTCLVIGFVNLFVYTPIQEHPELLMATCALLCFGGYNFGAGIAKLKNL